MAEDALYLRCIRSPVVGARWTWEQWLRDAGYIPVNREPGFLVMTMVFSSWERSNHFVMFATGVLSSIPGVCFMFSVSDSARAIRDGVCLILVVTLIEKRSGGVLWQPRSLLLDLLRRWDTIVLMPVDLLDLRLFEAVPLSDMDTWLVSRSFLELSRRTLDYSWSRLDIVTVFSMVRCLNLMPSCSVLSATDSSEGFGHASDESEGV